VQFHKAAESKNALLDSNKTQINGTVANLNKLSGNFSKISDSLNKADIGKSVRKLECNFS
jgi:phospholipid/cholesterol/gamma-HCH transport system substrate-binding protein